jgi:hypothetical protein
LLDSRHWKSAEAAATMPFQLDGDAIPTSRSSSRRSWVSTAEGIVERVEGTLIRVGEARASLRHSIPPCFELNALLGRRVRATLVHVAAIDSGLTQTLTITNADGELLVLAHSGEVRSIAHRLGKLPVYVALSQRPGGPMVFGTARVQAIVREKEHVRVRDEDETYVMHFEARESRAGNAATYAIGREEFWRGPPSTKR